MEAGHSTASRRAQECLNAAGVSPSSVAAVLSMMQASREDKGSITSRSGWSFTQGERRCASIVLAETSGKVSVSLPPLLTFTRSGSRWHGHKRSWQTSWSGKVRCCWPHCLPRRIQGGKAENASSVLCTAGRCKAAEHRSSGLKKCSVVRSFHQRPSTGMVDFAYLARSAFQILLFVYDLFYGVVCPSLRPQLLIVQKDHRRCFLQQWRCQWWHG